MMATSSNIAQVAVTEFTLFPKLLSELRLKVWGFVLVFEDLIPIIRPPRHLRNYVRNLQHEPILTRYDFHEPDPRIGHSIQPTNLALALLQVNLEA